MGYQFCLPVAENHAFEGSPNLPWFNVEHRLERPIGPRGGAQQCNTSVSPSTDNAIGTINAMGMLNVRTYERSG